MSNPLLSISEFPPFSAISPEHIQPAVEQLLADCRKTLDAVADKRGVDSWESLLMDLEEVDDKYSRAWGAVSHLNMVMNSPELREAYESCLPLISEYGTYAGQHEGVYQAIKAFADSDAFSNASAEQQEDVKSTLRDYKLSGIGLPEDKKVRYGEIKQQLSQLASTFSNNVLDATNAYVKQVKDEEELSGLPESAVAAAAELAQEKSMLGWAFTLDIPSYLPIMMYCDNAELRRELYEAFVTRASNQGPNAGEWDNAGIMDETLALRHELAQILGFENYGEYSLATKMAESTNQVLTFLHDLAKKSKPQAEKEVAELRAFAQKEFGVDDLNPWDMAYYGEKLKQAKYAISDEELRPYFPENKVIAGLFETASRLFSIKFEDATQSVERWHDTVRFYHVQNLEGERIGSFYLDLYARANKRGGAWMDDCLVRRRTQSNCLQLPIAYLTCNFNRPIGDKPALFTHDEVVTLFHEFGHGLHHLLTQGEVSGVSGINGVAWDAVELPSQFLENWCWQPEALQYLSSHYETGEPLPADMLQKMLDAKNFQSAMMMVRQLEFSLFDMRIHCEFNTETGAQVEAILQEVRDEVAVVQPPAFNRFANSFGHIFAGGYAAGYYSYKWAEVLSSDAFAKFEEDGIFNAETGKAFKTAILEKGGSAPAMELFKAFRGREPEIDALLRHSGIAA